MNNQPVKEAPWWDSAYAGPWILSLVLHSFKNKKEYNLQSPHFLLVLQVVPERLVPLASLSHHITGDQKPTKPLPPLF